ncbi:MAG: MATE family efflux transporter [Cellulosilyticaceae bacterium]
MQQVDLLKDEPSKLFLRYLGPSISATLVTSIYILADTIIIGKGVGSDGIAALNLLLPLFALFFGTGLLFGVGGGVLMSVAKGSEDQKLANRYFTNAVFAAAIVAFLYITLGTIFLKPIAYLLGSNENSIGLVMEYGKYLVIGAPLFICSSLLQALVRNDQAPKKAMVAVIAGGISNIILDCLFIYGLGMGMAGGAIATVIGSIISVTILLTHFKSPKNTMKWVKGSVGFGIVCKIFQNGLSSFLIEIASGLVIFFFNLQLLKYIGDIGVVVYSIVANSALVALSLFNGVAQGSQPLIATNFGGGKIDRVLKVRRLGVMATTIIGMMLFAVGFFFPEMIVRVFIYPTPEVVELATTAIRIYFIAFLMMNINILYSTYFQSIVNPQAALTICLLRGMILSIVLVFLLPAVLGVTGIWLVMPITELITLIIAIKLIKKTDKHLN